MVDVAIIEYPSDEAKRQASSIYRTINNRNIDVELYTVKTKTDLNSVIKALQKNTPTMIIVTNMSALAGFGGTPELDRQDIANPLDVIKQTMDLKKTRNVRRVLVVDEAFSTNMRLGRKHLVREVESLVGQENTLGNINYQPNKTRLHSIITHVFEHQSRSSGDQGRGDIRRRGRGRY